MPESIFPQHTTSADALFAQHQDAIEALLKANETRGILFPNTPYCLPGQCAAQGAVLGTLRQIPQPNRAPLMRALNDFGDDIVSLAEFYDRTLLDLDLQQTAGLVGAVGILIGKGMIRRLTAIGLGLTSLGWVVMNGIGVTAGYFAEKLGLEKGRCRIKQATSHIRCTE